ncbi:MAG TPA: plastocyanin/azurin family copper-binding protein [Ktedonobacterales bacterium]|nr:plastocyanin/azurin family copper-binding protein [Ktedonobacterales bacterium]
MKKIALALVPLALMLSLALGACGKAASDGGPGGGSTTGGSGGGNCKTTQTIALTQTDFADKCVTVSANQAVTFDDPSSSGGVHIICTGENGSCQANADAPSDLGSPGFQIMAGEQKQVTFTKPGTYKLACTVHPAMNMTVVVQ